jgi:hypothetical protein
MGFDSPPSRTHVRATCKVDRFVDQIAEHADYQFACMALGASCHRNELPLCLEQCSGNLAPSVVFGLSWTPKREQVILKLPPRAAPYRSERGRQTATPDGQFAPSRCRVATCSDIARTPINSRTLGSTTAGCRCDSCPTCPRSKPLRTNLPRQLTAALTSLDSWQTSYDGSSFGNNDG